MCITIISFIQDYTTIRNWLIYRFFSIIFFKCSIMLLYILLPGGNTH